MPTLAPSVFKEYSQAELDAENAQVLLQTKVERDWIEAVGARPYQTDAEILHDYENTSRLVRITQSLGYVTRQLLRDWRPEHSDPTHPRYYSPPFLAGHAFDMLAEVAMAWRDEIGHSRYLSVPSLTRSLEYQRRLAEKPDALTIKDPNELSSHTVGWAFDLDGCGIYERSDDGKLKPINPHTPGFSSTLMAESRTVLRQILGQHQAEGRINFVEELPASIRHCFHVCVKPPELL